MRTSWRPVVAALTGLAILCGPMLPSTAASGAVGPSLPVALAAGLPTALTLDADRQETAYGGSSTLTGRLTDPATGSGVAGAVVRLETRSVDGVWVEAAPITTDAGGAVSSTQTLTATTTYRLHHGDPGTPDESTSPEVTVSVHPALTVALSEGAVRAGRPVKVTGAIVPAEADVALDLERRTDGRWQRVTGARTAADGSYTLAVTAALPGSWSLRVVRTVRDDSAPRAGSSVDLPTLEVFRLHHYSVTTRGTIRADTDAFRARVAATYGDARGWARANHRFRAVKASSGRADFTVVLAQAHLLPTYSRVCSSMYSCRVGRSVIINQDRWRRGSPYFPGSLEQYRRMVVNHETGHWLGRGHAYCPAPGRSAPVMQQQSKGLHGCRVNPWPLPREVRAVP